MGPYSTCRKCGHEVCSGCETKPGKTEDGLQVTYVVCCRCGESVWNPPKELPLDYVHKEMRTFECPVCQNVEKSTTRWQLTCSQCSFSQVEFSEESGLNSKKWIDKTRPTSVGHCPVCGNIGHKKTMDALAARVEERFWESLPEKVETLLESELKRIDVMIDGAGKRRGARNVVAKAGLIATRASMKAQAVSKIMAAKLSKQ